MAQTDPIFPGVDVIDCDAHYSEPQDLWTSRAPASLKGRVPQVRNVDGKDIWFVDGDKPLGAVGASVITHGRRKVHGKLYLEAFDELDPSSYDMEKRIDVLDELGIGAQIVYPNVGGFGSARFQEVEDESLRLTCVQIYNDAIAEIQANSGGRIFPQAILPFWNRDLSMKEAVRVKEELQLRGLTIPDTPEKLGLPDFSDPSWSPFFELVQDLALPLNFHIGSTDLGAFTAAPWGSLGPERKMAVGATLLYLDNARVISNLLYSDVIENYPKLKFVSVESGIGWIPFLIEACEYQWDEMCPTEVKHHQMRPMEKFRNSIYACFWFEKDGPRNMIDKVGEDNVLFETDFPHPTCLYPAAREHLREVLADLPETQRRKVLHDNAARLYNID